MQKTKKADERFAAGELAAWATEAFRAAGVGASDAATTAGVLVRTSLRGIDTHGVSRIPVYLRKVLDGEVNATPRPTSTDRDGVLYYDGDHGLGQAVGMAAVAAGIDAARSRSVVPCVITNSGHLAALGMFALAAAEAGMIALLCQQTPPLMALPGFLGPAIGNNPIALAAPVAGRVPLVVDMATSTVARGNLLDAMREGEQIPQGWALGPDGEPTTDPAAALAGSMLPVGGHKGIGLSMMVQVLAASLGASGPMTVDRSAQSAAGDVGAFLLVLNPERMLGRSPFDQHMLAWLDEYLVASGPVGRYPGERAAASEEERRERGIPLSAALITGLREIGEAVGVPFDRAPLR